MLARVVCAVALVAATQTACTPINCIPTTTTARDAAIVMAPSVARSGVLVAHLQIASDQRPLNDEKIRFSVDPQLFIENSELGSESTDPRGDATLDLKNRPLKLVHATTKDHFNADFAGDGKYCASSDTAAIDIARVS